MSEVSWAPNGIRHTASVDESDNSLIINRMQDVSPILEMNKHLRSLGGAHYRGEDNTMWHYAKVPVIILEKLIREHGAEKIFSDDDDTLIKCIERDYPLLKVGDFRLA